MQAMKGYIPMLPTHTFGALAHRSNQRLFPRYCLSESLLGLTARAYLLAVFGPGASGDRGDATPVVQDDGDGNRLRLVSGT